MSTYETALLSARRHLDDAFVALQAAIANAPNRTAEEDACVASVAVDATRESVAYLLDPED